MDSSLAYATTPLALASLVIIAGIGILKLLVSGKNNALSRLITHYGFAAVILFGVLGNISYLVSTRLSSEAIVFGNVVDATSGDPVVRAVVDAGAHARGMTSDSGEFVLAIPASRLQDKYTISAAGPGYARASKEVDNRSRMFVTLALARKSDVPTLKFGEADVFIGHYLGLPEVYLPIELNNVSRAAVTMSNFSLTLTAPSGKVRQLNHVFSASSLNAPLGPPQPVAAETQARTSSVVAFGQLDHQVQLLSVRAFQALQESEGFRAMGPKVGQQYLAPEMQAEIVQAMNGNWFWETGSTAIRLVCIDDSGRRYEAAGKLSLSEGQVQAMKNSSEYYGAGYGIMVGQQLMPVGHAQPGQRVSLDKQ